MNLGLNSLSDVIKTNRNILLNGFVWFWSSLDLSFFVFDSLHNVFHFLLNFIIAFIVTCYIGLCLRLNIACILDDIIYSAFNMRDFFWIKTLRFWTWRFSFLLFLLQILIFSKRIINPKKLVFSFGIFSLILLLNS